MLLDTAPDDIYEPIPALLLFIFPFGSDYRPSYEEIRLIQTIAIAIGFLALIGLATRLSLLLFAVCNVFIVAWTYSFNDFHHTEAPLFLAFGILAFAPVGRVLSVDALLRRRRSDAPAPSLLSQEDELAGWAIHLIQWLLVLIYLSAVLSKLVFEGGLDWLNGYTLQYYLIQDTLRKGTLLGGWFSQHHYLVMLSQYVVVAFQVTFALAVIFPRLRWIYVPPRTRFPCRQLDPAQRAVPRVDGALRGVRPVAARLHDGVPAAIGTAAQSAARDLIPPPPVTSGA